MLDDYLNISIEKECNKDYNSSFIFFSNVDIIPDELKRKDKIINKK
jgi:hypothetical protein